MMSLAIWACLSFPISSTACTVSEDMLDSVPLNSDTIPNKDRIKIAEMVIRARQWPDAEIRGIVTAGAYIGEENPQALALRRAARLKEYLVQLGVKRENIWSDTHMISKPYPKDSAGYEGYLQIGLTLVPICKDGCRHLCGAAPNTPTSRVLR
ncbi:hypothetical protein [Burkholderia catarinensis]|uniref:hypothetical protein n=1 Tax=Burkholderia catarinensis TaxID=1108140 RepID=UPI0009193B86|nr:hypothetical protein [Burkholderia catarinensis]KAG8153276.1 hypothetical protein BFF94_011975 [Burkholderia catarinensis]